VHVLGIDLGGSGYRYAVVDTQSGRCHSPVTQRYHADIGPQSVVNRIAEDLRDINWNGPIGIGFPGVVESGRLLTAPNLGEAWLDPTVFDTLQPFHGGAMSLINDADAVALAEQRFGAGQGNHACVLTLTIGTGLGTTLHRNGVMVANLEYGRLPHPHRDGCLEDHLSGRTRRELDLSVESWAERFQEGLFHLEDLLEPDLIILYGGIVEHFDTFAPLLQTRAELVCAHMLGHAAVVGAALHTV